MVKIIDLIPRIAISCSEDTPKIGSFLERHDFTQLLSPVLRKPRNRLCEQPLFSRLPVPDFSQRKELRLGWMVIIPPVGNLDWPGSRLA